MQKNNCRLMQITGRTFFVRPVLVLNRIILLAEKNDKIIYRFFFGYCILFTHEVKYTYKDDAGGISALY